MIGVKMLQKKKDKKLKWSNNQTLETIFNIMPFSNSEMERLNCKDDQTYGGIKWKI